MVRRHLSLASRGLIALPFVSLVSWSSYVSHKRKKFRGKTDFIQGSMDDIIMDALDTGDIVCFDRKLQSMQPHEAAVSAWMKYVGKSSFDHCGIVIVDRKGTTFLLEPSTDGKKSAKLVLYSATVLQTEANEIVAIPLMHERTMEMRNAADAFVKSATAESSLSSSSFKKYFEQFSGKKGCNPSVNLTAGMYQHLGLLPLDNNRNSSLDTSDLSADPKSWKSLRLLQNATLDTEIPIRLA